MIPKTFFKNWKIKMLKQCNECRIEFHGLSFSNGFHATFDLIFVFVGSSSRFIRRQNIVFYLKFMLSR